MIRSPAAAQCETDTADAAGRQLSPPVGAIGYTGSYREPSPDIREVSVVSVLEAHGP